MASTHASMFVFDALIIDEITASLEKQTDDVGAKTSSEFLRTEYTHIIDAVVVTVIAWVVVVVVSLATDFLMRYVIAADFFLTTHIYSLHFHFRLWK
jgi:hypothetical protein